MEKNLLTNITRCSIYDVAYDDPSIVNSTVAIPEDTNRYKMCEFVCALS